MRKDIEIVMTIDDDKVEHVARLVAAQGLFVVSPAAGYCPAFILERYGFAPAGVLWQVIEKKSEPEVARGNALRMKRGRTSTK